MGIESAERYSPKAFRRGASMDIMASGSTLAQIMRSAGWHSQAFRAYLLFQMEEECNMKAIFAPSNRSKPKAKQGRKQVGTQPPPSPIPDVVEVSSEPDSTSSSSCSVGGMI